MVSEYEFIVSGGVGGGGGIVVVVGGGGGGGGVRVGADRLQRFFGLWCVLKV